MARDCFKLSLRGACHDLKYVNTVVGQIELMRDIVAHLKSREMCAISGILRALKLDFSVPDSRVFDENLHDYDRLWVTRGVPGAKLAGAASSGVMFEISSLFDEDVFEPYRAYVSSALKTRSLTHLEGLALLHAVHEDISKMEKPSAAILKFEQRFK